MRTVFIGRRVLVLTIAALAFTANLPAQSLEIRTLANEGVALSDGKQTVLIDALFDEGVRGYRRLDPPTQRSLLRGALGLPPVTVIFATHVHRDHFDAGVVLEFLQRHPGARFISTPQAVAALRRAGEHSTEDVVSDHRVHAFLPTEGDTLRLSADVLGTHGVEVTLLNLHHGRDRDPPIQNLGILVEMAGVRALHIGDTEVRMSDARALPWAELDVDVGLFPYWFLFKSHYLEVTRAIDPEHVVALHMPHEDAPMSYFAPARALEGLAQAIRTEFPNALVALEPGQQRRFPVATTDRPE